MNALEILLGRRWILKSRDRELYYRVRDELGNIRKFLNEKMGYQVIVNPYLIKVEKMPAKPECWMGIQEFTDKLEYVFLCLILSFLEEKETEEQFVLSELTEYIQSQYKEIQIEWTVYTYRRHLIKVLKYCVACGILNIDDGNEDNFMRDGGGEVLYENTGASRYFIKNFTQDIMDYTRPEDFMKEEWIDVNEDRGIVRRHRVYRSLLTTMGMYRTEENEEDFAYLRNFRNMIQGELSELLDCELQVYRNSAFLILGEECRMGRCFPEENTLSDIVLLCNSILSEMIETGEIYIPRNECIWISREQFRQILETCRERYGAGWNKTFREMLTEDYCRETMDYMKTLSMIEEDGDSVILRTVMGKVMGRYSMDFLKKEKGLKNEEQQMAD